MANFRRLMGFLRPYRREVWGSLAFAWLGIGVSLAIPLLVGRAVNEIQSIATDHGHKPDLLPLALAIAGVSVLGMAFTMVRRLISGRVSLGVEFDLRQRFYAHLQRLELGFFDSQQTGQLMSRATVDLGAIRFFLGYGLIFITQSMLTIALAGTLMVILNPWLALIALAPAPLVVFTAARYNRLSRPALQEVQQRIAELTVEAEESFSGIRIVKAFAREEYQLQRFRHAVTRVFDQSIYSTRLQAFFSPLIALLPELGMVAVFVIGGRAVIAHELSLGDFSAFYLLLLRLGRPMRMLGTVMAMAQRAAASGNRMFEVLDREPKIESPPGAPPLPAGGGEVELRGVTLRYDGAAPSLTDVSLSVNGGQTIALVGPSGSGKTSLVALIARLYDPSEGTVLIDGADIRTIDLVSLRSEIAFVADDSFLFTASVAENIAYARPQASQGEIELAAQRAQAESFIAELPQGYATRIGERGLTLSGGQRQRVAIARALLADPRILILDDATSSVDARTEAEIKAGLKEAMRGRTTFVIAHRLSTVSLADQVVVMDGGRIVDRGTHEELISRCGFYVEIAEHGLADSVFLQRDLEQREATAKL